MRRSARVLMLVGTLATVFGLGKLHAYGHTYDLSNSGRLSWTFAYTGVLLLAAYAVGLPAVPPRRHRLLVAAGGSVLGATLMSLVTLVVGGQLLPRFVIFGAAVAVIPVFVACAAVANGGAERERRRARVVLVADGDEADMVERELAADPELPAFLAAVRTSQELMSAGADAPLVRVCAEVDASVVVLCRHALELEYVVAQAAQVHRQGVRVRTLTDFYADWLGKVPISELEQTSVLFDIGELHGRRYARVKRIADIALGALGLVALGLLLPLVALGDLVANRGTLFFRQARVGRDGRVFTMLKLRTMEGGPRSDWTRSGDERITPFGRVLRRTHLDELPQVINILRGDLSIVGPRPEQPHYVEELTDKIPFYDLRHVVRPGLTGWAQVKFGYASDEHDALEKLQYDFFYLQHQTLALDARVVARTLREIVGGRGR